MTWREFPFGLIIPDELSVTQYWPTSSPNCQMNLSVQTKIEFTNLVQLPDEPICADKIEFTNLVKLPDEPICADKIE